MKKNPLRKRILRELKSEAGKFFVIFFLLVSMIGLVSGWLWIILKKVKVPDVPALAVVGFLGSMTNTVAVMGSIYFLLAEQYAAAREVALSAVYGLIMATITGAGVMEALAALVLVTAIGKVLLASTRKLFK